jgi:hypothetical protein
MVIQTQSTPFAKTPVATRESSVTALPSQQDSGPNDQMVWGDSSASSGAHDAFALKVMGGFVSSFPAIGGMVTFFGAAGNAGHGNLKGAAAGLASVALNFASLMAIDRPHLILPAMAAAAGAAGLGAYSWHQLAVSATAAQAPAVAG